ncbi:MAG: TRAP transporter fused permease subunit [Desulfobacteraceae bacterium]|nr:MAG: TRAP transporter fused permease subunit [Desulfobacteraceae bacterium]
MKKTLREYIRQRKGTKGILALLGIALAIFQLYTGLFGSLDALGQRSIHLGLALLIVFLSRPAFKTEKRWLPYLNIGAIVLCLGSTAYIFVRYDWITAERFALISPLSLLEAVLSLVTVLLVLEGARRTVGMGLVVVVICFLLYPFAGPYLPGVLHSAPIGVQELLDFQYLGTSGIFGIPLGVSATEIALFIIFSSVITRSGIAVLLNNFAVALTGKYRGGPAKIAVVASSLMGTISGSGTANVVATGSITIPMMKKAGYQPHFAGAVEAVASTGGQIMPPVMGAAAFVMSAFTGIPYITIILYAVFPAVLFYTALLIMIHLEAVRYDLTGVAPECSLRETAKDYGHMVIPIVLLIVFMIIGYTPRLSAGIATVTALFMAQIRKTTRLSIAEMLEALEEGSKNLLLVAVATAAAGMIVGVVDLTGLGQRLGAGLLALSGGKLLPALVLTMILSIILGMGMPTTAAYIIQAATVIPALIFMGLQPFVAHMFSFYFACLSLITPPVAISAYAAAAIAQASIWKTGWVAFRLGLAGFIVPFMFAYGPSILLVGSVGEIIVTVATALVGVAALAFALAGFLFCTLKIWERLIAGAAAILLIAPSIKLILPGTALLAVLLILQTRRFRRMKTGISL